MTSLILSLLVFFGNSTTFSETDRFNPNPNLACLHRPLKKGESALAHRTLPCGTRVMIYNLRTQQSTYSIVKDRGPYGKYPSGRYKSELDMTPRVAKEIGHNGMEKVLFIAEDKPKKQRAPNS